MVRNTSVPPGQTQVPSDDQIRKSMSRPSSQPSSTRIFWTATQSSGAVSSGTWPGSHSHDPSMHSAWAPQTTPSHGSTSSASTTTYRGQAASSGRTAHTAAGTARIRSMDGSIARLASPGTAAAFHAGPGFGSLGG